MFKRILLLPLGILLAVAFAAAGTAGTRGESDGGTTVPTVDQGSALVQLKGAPLSTYEKTKPAPGKKVDFSSSTTKAYRAQLSALRNDFKAWLRGNAPKASVTGEFDIALNAVAVKLNGTALGTIASAPMVQRAELQGIYRPAAHDDPDLALINAAGGWGPGGGAAAGAGVKVAIIDSGIDTSHPCFGGGKNGGTNAKVIVAKVFNNNAKNKGYGTADENGHGTHVAGTVACNLHTPAVTDGVAIDYAPSGVAPAALLGNYAVFPADVDNARSEDILNALEAAYADGFDVANMSLGGGSHGIQDLLSDAVDDLDEAGMVVAVAAGNSGPGVNTIESPGLAPRALTAGGITVGHFLATPITAGGTVFNAASGDLPTVKSDLTKNLKVVADAAGPNGLSTACNTNKPAAGSLTDTIAVISRGVCTFSEKVRNAQDAGAVAAIVVNNTGGDPIAMGLGGIPNEPTIAAYMVAQSDAAGIKAKDGSSTTISATQDYVQTPNSNLHYNSTSRGPTDVDFRVKPDVVAPAVNVLSSQPAGFCTVPPCWAFYQGTSMATPHLAGMAAVLRGQHPTWSAAQIRSAIVNTADQNVVKAASGSGALETNVNAIGAGRANLGSATNAKVALDPVSVSFGAVPSGSGQTSSITVDVSALLPGAAATSATVSAASGTGVSYSATVVNGDVVVTMTSAKGAGPGPHQATLRVNGGGGEIAHAAVFSWIK